MKRTITVDEWTCDAVCGIAPAQSETALRGYHGTAVAADGTRADWYACIEGHIGAAVVNSLNRERNQ